MRRHVPITPGSLTRREERSSQARRYLDFVTRIADACCKIGVGPELVAGRWLDGQIHTGMLFTLIGVFTGLVAGASPASSRCTGRPCARVNSSGAANRSKGQDDKTLTRQTWCACHAVCCTL